MFICAFLITKDCYYNFLLGQRVTSPVPWFHFFPPPLSSLADVEYESVLLREGAELLVFDLGRLAEALVLVWML